MSAINNDLDIQQSMKSVDYLLEKSKFIHNNQCRIEFGIVGGNDVSQTKSSLVDIENDLKGITRTANKCVEYNYVPTQNNLLEPINLCMTKFTVIWYNFLFLSFSVVLFYEIGF